MSSGGELKERGARGPMEPNTKPFTPFSIEDILSRPPAARRSPPQPLRTRGGAPQPADPLCALEELASKTFRGLEVGVLQAAEGHEPMGSYGHRSNSKKRRKSRTAFTNHQIYELEKRFLYQKYLSPADRDHIAQQLGLSNAQVITWFQNRRAKMKRDLEEMKADVESLKKLPPHTLEKLVSMPEGEPGEEDEDTRMCSPTSQGLFLHSPQCLSMEHTVDEFSEDEEIEVDN
ncbi:transcription factor LBX2 [Hyla sarda]|uniref:transcription factor LBX2 n=1 Tax=Hyla sarda TaxID=327740 RepID=UPI0024C22A6F|nr:transcription factor LBX2 [Hyla sarda]